MTQKRNERKKVGEQVCFEIFPKNFEDTKEKEETKEVSLDSLIKGISRMKTSFNEIDRTEKLKSPFTFETFFSQKCYRFLVTCPHLAKKTLENKFKRTWGECDTSTTSFVDEKFPLYQTSYSDVVMQKKDVLPLSFNLSGEILKSNEPLSSLINVAQTLSHNESFMVQYFVIPVTGYAEKIKRFKTQLMIEELKNGGTDEIPNKMKETLTSIAEEVGRTVDDIFVGILGEDNYNPLVETNKTLKTESRTLGSKLEYVNLKNESSFFNVRIRVFAKATNIIRRKEIIYEVLTALKTVEGCNQLATTKVHDVKNQGVFERRYSNEWALKNMNHLSGKELVTFLTPPSKKILKKTPQIRQVKVGGEEIPAIFHKGTVPMGVANPLSPHILYQPTNDLDVFMLPKVLLGPPGSGKSTYLIWYILGLNKLKHNVFFFDYIKKCECTKEIEKVLDSTQCEVWDFSDPEFLNTFSFSYDEIYYNWKKDDFQVRYDIADLIQDQLEALLDALNDGVALNLTNRMKRALGAAAKAVFVHKGETLYTFYQVLCNYDKRMEYIKKGLNERDAKGDPILNQDDINELIRLNEVAFTTEKDPETGRTEKVKYETGETNMSLIEPIANRMYVFFKNNRIKKISQNKVTDKYDLYRIFEQSKTVLVRMPQNIFSEEVRASIVAFLTLKIWFVKQCGEIRGVDDETFVTNKKGERIRLKDMYPTHLIYDEVHQIPATLKFLSEKIKEFRKFRICPLITSHNFDDFAKVGRETFQKIDSCQPSYMLLTTPHKKSLGMIEHKLYPVTVEEALRLPRRYAINVVSTETACYSFVCKTLGGVEDAINYYKRGELKMPSLADSIPDILEEEEDEICFDDIEKNPFKRTFNSFKKRLISHHDQTLLEELSCDSSQVDNEIMFLDEKDEEEVEDNQSFASIETKTLDVVETVVEISPQSKPSFHPYSTFSMTHLTPKKVDDALKATSFKSEKPLPLQKKKRTIKPLNLSYSFEDEQVLMEHLHKEGDDLKTEENFEKVLDNSHTNNIQLHKIYQEVPKEKQLSVAKTKKKKGGLFMNQNELMEELKKQETDTNYGKDSSFPNKDVETKFLKELTQSFKEINETNPFTKKEEKELMRSMSSEEMKKFATDSLHTLNKTLGLFLGNGSKEELKGSLKEMETVMKELYEKNKEAAEKTGNETLIRKMNEQFDTLGYNDLFSQPQTQIVADCDWSAVFENIEKVQDLRK